MNIIYPALFAAIIVICSWISIPLTVPVTLQTFAVFASVGLLGTYRGTLSVILYIMLGAVGLPVFSGFRGGFGILLGNTGGFVIGFVFAAFLSGAIIDHFGKKTIVLIIAMVSGLIVCYLFGTLWFVYIYTKTISMTEFLSAVSVCVLPFIIPDALKIGAAIFIVRGVTEYIKH